MYAQPVEEQQAEVQPDTQESFGSSFSARHSSLRHPAVFPLHLVVVEVDLDIEKSSDLDVDAEKEKARSRWDEPEDVSHSRDPDEESEKDEGSSRVGTPTLPSSPRSCPPTPEALPQGLRTPPPSTSSSGQVR